MVSIVSYREIKSGETTHWLVVRMSLEYRQVKLYSRHDTADDVLSISTNDHLR